MIMADVFGSLVFNDTVMQERLPKYTYKELKSCIAHDKPISLDCATVIANAMKDWAIEKGCTHYTHWFQPMTGITAEKSTDTPGIQFGSQVSNSGDMT